MKPPDWLAARVTRSVRATSIRWEAESLVHTISAPAFWQISSATTLAATGRATRVAGIGLGDQGQQHQQGLVVGEHVAQVVDDGHVLAAGVEHRPQVGARGPHQLGHPRRAGLAVEGQHAGGVGVGVDRQHLGLQLGQHVGHDEAGRAEGVVEHQLEVGAAGRWTGRPSRSGRRCSARGSGAGSRCRRSPGPAPGGSPPGGRGARSCAGWPRRCRCPPCRRSGGPPTGGRRAPAGR